MVNEGKCLSPPNGHRLMYVSRNERVEELQGTHDEFRQHTGGKILRTI